MATLNAGLNILTANTVAVNDPAGVYIEKDPGNADEVGAFFWSNVGVEVHGLNASNVWVSISTTSQTQKFVNISWQTYSKIQLISVSGTDAKVRAFPRISTGVVEKTIATTRLDKVSHIPDVADYDTDDSGKLATIDASGNVVFQNPPSSNAPTSTDGRFPAITAVDTSEVLYNGASTPETLIELTGAGFEPDSKIYMFSSAAVAADYENLTNFETGLLDSVVGDAGVVDDPDGTQTTFSATDTTVMGWSESDNEFGGVRAFGYKNPTTMTLSIKPTDTLYGTYSLLVVNSNGNKALYNNCLTVSEDPSWRLTLTSVTPTFALLSDTDTFTITGGGYDNDTNWYLFKENLLATNLVGSDLEETGTPTGGSVIPGSSTEGAITVNNVYQQTSTTNQWLDLDPSADYVFGTGDFTISYWIKAAPASTHNIYQRIFQLKPYGHNRADSLQIVCSRGNLSWGGANLVADTHYLATVVGASYGVNVRTTVVQDNTWHHVAFIRRGDVFCSYTDGILTQTQKVSGVDLSYTDGSGLGAPRIGNMVPDYDPSQNRKWGLEGKLEQFCVWKKALTNAQIKSLATTADTSTINFIAVDKSDVNTADYSFDTDPSNLTTVTTSPAVDLIGERGDKYSIVATKESQRADLENAIVVGGIPETGVVALDAWDYNSYPETGDVWLDLTENNNHATKYNDAIWSNQGTLTPTRDTSITNALLDYQWAYPNLIGTDLEETGTISAGATNTSTTEAGADYHLQPINDFKANRVCTLLDDSVVRVPGHPDYNFGANDFSIGMWIRTSDYSYDRENHGGAPNSGSPDNRTRTLLTTAVTASGTAIPLYLYIDPTHGGIGFCVDNSGPNAYCASWYEEDEANWKIADGRWHHVTLVRENQQFKMYVDGVDLGQETDSSGNSAVAVIDNSPGFHLGGHPWDNNHWAHNFIGSLEQVTVWNKAISLAEAKTLWSGTPTGTEQIADTSIAAAMIADSTNSLYTIHTELENAGLPNPTAIPYGNSEKGADYRLQSINDFKATEVLTLLDDARADIPADSYYNFGTGDFSIGMWLRMTDFSTERENLDGASDNVGGAPGNGWSGYRAVFLGHEASFSGTTWNINFVLRPDQNNGSIIVVNDHAGVIDGVNKWETPGTWYNNNSVSRQKAPVCDGKWHYVLVVREGGDFRQYVDGVDLGIQQGLSAAAAAYPVDFSTAGFHLCGFPTPHAEAHNAIGSFEQVTVWDRALNATDANKLWSGNAAGTGTEQLSDTSITSAMIANAADSLYSPKTNLEETGNSTLAGPGTITSPPRVKRHPTNQFKTAMSYELAGGKPVAFSAATGGIWGDAWADLPPSSEYNHGGNDFAYAFWFKSPTTESGVNGGVEGNYIFRAQGALPHNASNKALYLWNLTVGGVGGMHLGSSGIGGGMGFSNVDVNDNQWHHIVLQRKGDAIEYYVDGTLQVSITNWDTGATVAGTVFNTDSTDTANGPRLFGAEDPSGHYYNGLMTIEQFCVWNNKHLTAAEVKTLWSGTAAGTQAITDTTATSLMIADPNNSLYTNLRELEEKMIIGPEGPGADATPTRAIVHSTNQFKTSNSFELAGGDAEITTGGVWGDAYIDLEPNEKYNFGTNDFAFSFWFKSPTLESGWQPVGGGVDYSYIWRSEADLADTVSPKAFHILQRNSHDGFVLIVTDNGNADGGGYHALDQVNVNDGNWHHVVIQRKEGSLEYYVDGTLRDTSATISETGNSWNQTLNVHSTSTTNGPRMFGAEAAYGAHGTPMCTVEQMSVWGNRSLTAEEVNKLWSGSTDGTGTQMLTDTLTSYPWFRGSGALAEGIIDYNLEEKGTRTGGELVDVVDTHIAGQDFVAKNVLDCTNSPCRVDIDNPENYRFGTDDFTMSFWLKKSTAATNWDTIFNCDGYNDASGTLPWIGLIGATASNTSSNNTGAASSTDSDNNAGGFSWTRIAGHMLIFNTKNNVYNFFLQTTMNVCDGQWRHFTVRKAGDTMDLYVNGLLDASITVAGLEFNYPVTMASLANRGPHAYGNSHPLDGKLEQFTVWKRALLVDEIIQLYSFGNLTPYVKAWNFDGNKDYLKIDGSASTQALTEDLTLVSWVQVDPGTEGPIMGNDNNSYRPGCFGLVFYQANSGGGYPQSTLTFWRGNGGTAASQWERMGSDSEVNLDDGQWHMITVTCNSGEWKMYVDDTLVGTHTNSKAVAFVENGDIYLGTAKWQLVNPGNVLTYTNLNGKIGEAYILDYAVTEANMTKFYDSTKAKYVQGVTAFNVDSVNPASIQQSTATDFTINGTGFEAGMEIYLYGPNASLSDITNLTNADFGPSNFTIVSETQMSATGLTLAGDKGQGYTLVAQRAGQIQIVHNAILIGSLADQAVISLDAWDTDSYSGTGNTWYDLTSNNNDGTLVGNTVYTEDLASGLLQDTTTVTTLLNIPGSLARGLIGANLENTGTPINTTFGSDSFANSYAVPTNNTGHTTSCITLDNPSEYIFGTSDFTMSWWVKAPTMTVATGGIFGSTFADSGALGYKNPGRINIIGSNNYSTLGDQTVALLTYNAAGAWDIAFSTNTAVFDDTWHHVSLVRIGDRLMWYVDGVIDNTMTKAGMNFNFGEGEAVEFGLYNEPNRLLYGMACQLEQFCVWRRGLTPDEIKTLYTGVEKPAPIATTATTDAMLADAGNSLNTGLTFSNAQEDQTGHTHTPKAIIADRTYGGITCLNATFYTATSNGGGSYNQPASSSDWETGTDDFSISFWVKGNAAHYQSGKNRRIFRNASHSNSNSNHLQIIVADQNDTDGDGNSIPMGGVYVYTITGGLRMGSKSSVVNGKYNHVVFTRESDLFKIYINGVLESQMTFSGVNFTGTRPHFGCWSAGSQQGILWGSIGQFCLWNGRAITESEVQKLYCGTTFSTTAVANTSTIDPMFTKGDAITNDLVAANMEDLSPINTAVDHPTISPGTLSNTTYANDGITATGVLTLDSSNNEHRDLPLSTDWIIGTSDYTWSCWIKTTTSNLDGSVSRRIYSSVAEDNSWAYGNHIDKFQVFLNTADGTVRTYDSVDLAQSTTNVADGNWHHICYVKDYNTATSLDRCSIYVDGKLEHQRDMSLRNYNRQASNGPRIGAYSRTGGNFNGQIEQMCLWKRPLSQSEIYQLMAVPPIQYVKSFKLDGSGDRIEIADSPSLSGTELTSDITIAAWIKTTNSDRGRIISNNVKSNSMDCAFDIMIHSDGTVEFRRGDGTAYTSGLSSTTTVDDDQWHFVVCKASGQDWTIAIDGNIDATGTFDATVTYVDSGVWIGDTASGSDPNTELNGNVSEAYVWNHAVPNGDLVQFYNDTKTKYTTDE